MNQFKLLPAILVASLAALVAQAQNIAVVSVQGDAEIIDNNTGERSGLEPGASLSGQSTLVTGSDSAVTVALGNGALMNLSQNSSVNIMEYSENGESSKVRLFMNYGQVIGQTQATDNGSAHVITTPAGIAKSSASDPSSYILQFDQNQRRMTFASLANDFSVINRSTGEATALTTGEQVVIAPEDGKGEFVATKSELPQGSLAAAQQILASASSATVPAGETTGDAGVPAAFALPSFGSPFTAPNALNTLGGVDVSLIDSPSGGPVPLP